jgi:hypothetical protein
MEDVYVDPNHFNSIGMPHLKRLILGKQFNHQTLLLCLLNNSPQLQHLHIQFANNIICKGIYKEIQYGLFTLKHLISFQGNLSLFSVELFESLSKTIKTLEYYNDPHGLTLLLEQCIKTRCLRSLKCGSINGIGLLNWLDYKMKPEETFDDLIALDISTDGFDYFIMKTQWISMRQHIPNLQHLSLSIRPCEKRCESICDYCHSSSFYLIPCIIDYWYRTLQSLAFCIPVFTQLNGAKLGRMLTKCQQLKQVRITEATLAIDNRSKYNVQYDT